jgi:hypothetical protein
MRGVIVKLLRHEGYRVLHASTAEEGVCLADSLPVDLLVSGALTDHRASDPIAALMAARPTMKRVCIGHRAETPRLTLFNRERTMVLERPLSSSTLIESVRAMLEDTA